MWGIIGGSGFEQFEGFKTIQTLDRNTPFGEASSGLRRVEVQDREAIFISRHGSHHELLPSEINYRANIYALKALGVTKILSISAVGSLEKNLKPGDLVIPKQYIDRTKGLRKHTFCGDGVVGHVSLAHPVSQYLADLLNFCKSQFAFDIHFNKTYVCVEGPYFSSQAESKSYRAQGADIIGMSNFPEYALAREAGISYLPCCFVTDYDCWDDSIPHCTIEEIIKVMKSNNHKAFEIVKTLLKEGVDHNGCSHEGLKTGLMVPFESIPREKQKWLEILMK